MAKTTSKKQRSNNRNNKKHKLGLKGKGKKLKTPIADHDPAVFPAGSDDEDSPTPDKIQRLLEPYTKEQLIGFLLDAAASTPDLVARIRAIADTDVSHRKVFVHGLGWDTTTETLREVFQPFGEIEDCKVVIDKVTGRAKGYGFVLFATRAAATKALKEPEKKIKSRYTHSQLASIGPIQAGAGGTAAQHASAEGRRVYVSNVHADADSEKLKAFFAKFGEIEAGPFGFDMNTGKSRGFALFVYKTQEGAAKALLEPYKMFEGHQLHCQKATDPAHKAKAAAAVPAAVVPPAAMMGAAQQPVLAAMAAAQNLALYQNPAYAALLAQNPLFAAAMLNPAAAVAALNPAATLNPAVLNPMTAASMNQAANLIAPQGQGYAPQGQGYTNQGQGYTNQGQGYTPQAQGYAPPLGQDYGRGEVGAGTSSSSLLGAYGSQGSSGLQGLQYGHGQYGQSSSARSGGSFGGYPSYYCTGDTKAGVGVKGGVAAPKCIWGLHRYLAGYLLGC